MLDFRIIYMTKWRRCLLVLMCVWILVSIFVLYPIRCSNHEEDAREIESRLMQVSRQLEMLKSEYNRRQLRIDINDNVHLNSGKSPPIEYELMRRRLSENVRDLWNFVNTEIQKLNKEPSSSFERLNFIRDDIAERKRSLLNDLSKLSKLDSFDNWRHLEAANLSDLVQRRLHHLQNPKDCKSAPKVVCNLNKSCGFGCQLHHIVFCLIFAYGTERTLIMNSSGWRYNPKGWEYIFKPISYTCRTTYDEVIHQYPGEPNSKVISLPFIDAITSKKPKFLPLAIPKDLANRILSFNGDPPSWWIGQMMKYLMKLKPNVEKMINNTMQKLVFKNPIVGIHIRRTDKVGTEAAFHSIDEYMIHVKDYYDTLDMTQIVDKRRVYLASDDPSVLSDARKKYPDYTFLGDPVIAKSAATHIRYNPTSLYGLLIDLHLLASTDFIVCTLSSQVCRVAYQMMQANRMDASESIKSLDDIYYYGGQNAHNRVAVLPHKRRNSDEINAEIGDFIGIAGNHWNGFGRGTNQRTNQVGLIPWYKTNDHYVYYAFPEYKEVPINKVEEMEQNNDNL